MHDCQKFREDWIAGVSDDFASCEECCTYCQEADTILQAAGAAALPVAELPDDYWHRYDTQLRQELQSENASRLSSYYWKLGAVAAAAVLAIGVTWMSVRAPRPIAAQATVEHIQLNTDHIQGLDPMVVTFLGQSEMFLRSFTKIQPSDVEDLADARVRARHDLMQTQKQRLLAADFAPARIVLDEYEIVLRDIKNLDSPQDLADIQTRIERNGLIANMKANQPRIVLVSQR